MRRARHKLKTNQIAGNMAFEFWLRKTRLLVGAKNEPVCPNSILLLKEKPTTFGRSISGETNVRLLSKNTPLMISRKHATVSFCKALGKWTVVDHDSLNGVYHNETRIPGSTAVVLKPGDKLCFGVGVDLNLPEFEYTFEVLMGNKKKRSADSPLSGKDNETKQRKVLTESEANINQASGSSKGCSFQTETDMKAAEDKIEKLKLSLEEKEKSYSNVLQQLNDMEKDLQTKLLEQKNALESEKAELQNNLRNCLAEQLYEKEQLLNQQLMEQKSQLMAEKEKVEIELQKEMNRKLEEKDRELEGELLRQKAELEQIIQEKAAQQETLEMEVASYREAQEKLQALEETERTMKSALQELQQLVQEKDEALQKQEEDARKAEETARKTVVEQMEEEFTCIVCQELFINACTLACSHSFCEHCLHLWLGKKNNCPMCRHPLRGKPIRSIVLDNAIAKMVEAMDDEAKEHRRAIIEERQNLQRAARAQTEGSQQSQGVIGVNERPQRDRAQEVTQEARHVQPHPGPTHPNEGTRRPHRNERSIARESRHVEPRPGPSHGYHDNQRYHHPSFHARGYHGNGGYGDNIPNHFVDAIPNYAYPGHGHCFICGMRGHWARGCPYRH